MTRRIFAWIPREGLPIALTHAIEPGPWRRWPAAVAAARSTAPGAALEGTLRRWCAASASRWSIRRATPCRISIACRPACIEMVRAAGARRSCRRASSCRASTPSWTDEHLASHRRAAEIIADDRARRVRARRRARAHRSADHRARADGSGSCERFARAGPRDRSRPERSRRRERGQPALRAVGRASPRDRARATSLLIDLWAHASPAASTPTRRGWRSSAQPSAQAAGGVGRGARRARRGDRARARERARRASRCAAPTRTTRRAQVIESRGFGEYFTHRTGHSIDARDLHGSGPHLDNLETREERLLIPGVGFSIEPGIYMPGEIGMRSEVNAYVDDGKAVITPREYQRELILRRSSGRAGGRALPVQTVTSRTCHPDSVTAAASARRRASPFSGFFAPPRAPHRRGDAGGCRRPSRSSARRDVDDLAAGPVVIDEARRGLKVVSVALAVHRERLCGPKSPLEPSVPPMPTGRRTVALRHQLADSSVDRRRTAPDSATWWSGSKGFDRGSRCPIERRLRAREPRTAGFDPRVQARGRRERRSTSSATTRSASTFASSPPATRPRAPWCCSAATSR